MEDFSLCRTCLSHTSLNPIFVDCADHTEYSNAIFVTTGLKVESHDGLPQKMCTDCVEFLNNCLTFRKKCKDSEISLLNMKKEFELNKNVVQIEIMGEKKMEDIDEDDKPLTHFVEKTEGDCEDFESNNDIHIETVTCNNIENINVKNNMVETDIMSQGNTLAENNKAKDTNVKVNIATETEPLYEVLDADKKRVLCRLCQKELSIRSIHSHIARNHPGADKKRVKCELCNRYVMRAKLNRHMVLMHGSGTFKCIYCKLEHDSRESLIEHAATCLHKKKRKPSVAARQLSQCPECHKTMQRGSLRAHAARHARPALVCEHCGRRLSTALRLLEHARAKHGYDKLRCRYCDFRSAGLPALLNHERRHRGEKPFVCEACGARFHAAYLLAQHRHSHRTEKLVKCEQCPASFKAPNSLHAHRRSVHGAAQFRCDECGRRYRCRHYAVRHLRQVHRYRGSVPPVRKEIDVVVS